MNRCAAAAASPLPDVPRRGRWWRRYGHLLALTVCVVLLVAMVWLAGPRLLWQNIVRLRGWIVAAVGVWAVGYGLNAASWGTIIGCYAPQRPLSWWRLFRFTVTGFAINYVTPFGLLGGEPYRVWALRPYVGGRAATSAVILYMMMHICSHFVFWMASCGLAALVLADVSWRLGIGLVGVSVVSAVCVWLFFRGYRRGLMQSLVGSLSRWPFVGARVSRWQQSRVSLLEQVDEGIITLLGHHPRRFWLSLGLEFLSRVVNCAEVWLLTFALGHPVGWAGAILVVAFASLFANLLFFSPLQMGTREGGIFLALGVVLPGVGVTALVPLAVTVSMATRIREFVWIALGLLFWGAKPHRPAA